MISKYMRGRLGNQLFQYATIRYIQEVNNNNDEITLNFSKYVYSKNFENELKYFNVKKYTEKEKLNLTFKQKLIIFLFKIEKRIIRFFNKKKYYIIRHKLETKKSKKLISKGIYWMEDGYLNITPSKIKNKIAIGHFESKKNFDNIRKKLLTEITPINAPLEKNKELYNVINSTNSICISIRRGDFVTNKQFSKKYNVCGNEYFNNAIKKIKEKVKNPVFIVFSDDIDWCKKNIKIEGQVYFEDGTDPVWEKLRLMYSCKHFIISNSTFSWWAQYLSRNKNKIVIAPSKWANTGYKDDIYDESWIIIKN